MGSEIECFHDVYAGDSLVGPHAATMYCHVCTVNPQISILRRQPQRFTAQRKEALDMAQVLDNCF